MAYAYSDLWQHANAWTSDAVAQGRVDKRHLQRLIALGSGEQAELFAAPDAAKPLIVAFMGGTGV